MDKEYREHLNEAKIRALGCFILFFLVFAGCCTVANSLFDRALKPAKDAGFEVISVSPGDALVAEISLLLAISLMVELPWVFIQVIEFVSPAVKRANVAKLRFFGLITAVLFYAGLVFSFFVILPFFFRFMAGFGEELDIYRSFSISEYMGFVLTFSLCMGTAFETPLAVSFMWWFGVIDKKRVRKLRGAIYVFIFAGAAFITPPDVISQLMVALPMLALFEVGNMMGRRYFTQKRRPTLKKRNRILASSFREKASKRRFNKVIKM